MRAKPQFGSPATLICLGGYIASVAVIFMSVYQPGDAPAFQVRLVAMLGAAVVALRCARLDAEGR